MILSAALALGATIAVPDDQPTLDAALAVALAGDVIQLAPGDHRNTQPIRAAVTITSRPGSEPAALTGAAGVAALRVDRATVTLSHLVIRCRGDLGVVGEEAGVYATDISIDACPAAAFQATVGGAWILDEVRVANGSAIFQGSPELLDLRRVTAHELRADAPLVRQTGGTQVMADVSVTNGRFATTIVENDRLTDLSWERVVLGCNDTGPNVAVHRAGSVGKSFLFDHIALLGNRRAPTSEAVMVVDAPAIVHHGTIIGDGRGTLFSGSTSYVLFESTILARAAGVIPTAWHPSSAIGGLNALSEIAVVPDALARSGRFGPLDLYTTDIADCRLWDLRPGPGSAARDLAITSAWESDGSPADAGVTGGQGPLRWGTDGDGDGFTIRVDCDDRDREVHPEAADRPNDGLDADCDGVDPDDADGDGYPDGVDCDDFDPLTYPGAQEDLAAVDRNCDDLSDPTDPLELVGCALPGAPSFALAALGAALARRRRRPINGA